MAKILLETVLARDPRCVLCAGYRASETLEHMPSRIVFHAKSRPKGLEVGVCKICNGATRRQEQVIAVLTRIYPDAVTTAQKQELKEVLRAAEHNNPGLVAELRMDQLPFLQQLGPLAHQLPRWDFLSLDGPICKKAIGDFGYKLGAVLHYHASGFRALPQDGWVIINPITNVDAHLEGPPQEVLNALGPPSTLRMGSWNVFDQFRYASAFSPEGAASMHMVVFRESFALQLIASKGQIPFPFPLDTIRFVQERM